MKHIYLLLLTLTITTTVTGMKRKKSNARRSLALTKLPDDCLRQVYSYIDPQWINWKKDSKNLSTTANTIQSLTLTCKSFNRFFSPTHIASLLLVDDTNKNLFLLRSAQAGIPCLVRHALTLGADVNYNKKSEFQPLVGAVVEKRHRCARILLNANANTMQSIPNAPSHHQPIHIATSSGDLEMVRLLLKFNADPNLATALGYTPLKLAKIYKHTQIAKLLVKKGAIIPKKYTKEVPKKKRSLIDQKNQ